MSKAIATEVARCINVKMEESAEFAEDIGLLLDGSVDFLFVLNTAFNLHGDDQLVVKLDAKKANETLGSGVVGIGFARPGKDPANDTFTEFVRGQMASEGEEA